VAGMALVAACITGFRVWERCGGGAGLVCGSIGRMCGMKLAPLSTLEGEGKCGILDVLDGNASGLSTTSSETSQVGGGGKSKFFTSSTNECSG
jgi:hypothetical protein